MKHSIHIKQKKLIELAPDMKLLEAAVLDFIYWFCVTKSKPVEHHRVIFEGKKYTWISYPYLIKEYPMLKGRTSATLTPVFKKLEKWGFIKTRILLGKGKKYVTLLDKTYEVFGRPSGVTDLEN